MGLEATRAGSGPSRKVDRDQWVVGEIRTDTGQVDDAVDAERLQLGGRTDARAGEDHRAGIGARGEHDAVGFDDGSVEEADPGRSRAGELDACHHRVRPDA